MYARDIDNRRLTFGVSGMLWNQSLVMYDRETGSLWSHILGEAMQGPLRGKRLKQVPSVLLDWQSWNRRHPDGTVLALSRTSQEYTRDFYTEPGRFVFGVVLDDEARAWGLDLLGRTPVVNDQVARRPVLVVFDRSSATARLFDRRLDGRILNFQTKDQKLRDDETGSTWDPLSGRALAGTLEGKMLVPLPGILSYKEVWYVFHPGSGAGAPRR